MKLKKLFASKKFIAILATVLLLTVAAGSTLAYILTNTAPVENVFTPSKVSCSVVEKNDSETTTEKENGNVTGITTKKDVQLKNTGDTNAFIRVKIVVTWKGEGGTVFAQAPVKDIDYSIAFADNKSPDKGEWVEGADGFYYYTKEVVPGDMTDFLISEAKALKTAPVDGFTLSIEIVASAIQSHPDDVVVKQWSNYYVKVSANGGSLTVAPAPKQ